MGWHDKNLGRHLERGVFQLPDRNLSLQGETVPPFPSPEKSYPGSHTGNSGIYRWLRVSKAMLSLSLIVIVQAKKGLKAVSPQFWPPVSWRIPYSFGDAETTKLHGGVSVMRTRQALGSHWEPHFLPLVDAFCTVALLTSWLTSKTRSK